MGFAEIPDGLPRRNPTVSYWQLPPHAIANHRTTAELPTSTTFDYVIIGSGITGAATAYKLLTRDANASILMLEARTAASGASGRNGGQCRAGWWLNFNKYAEKHGEEEAIKFEILEEQNVRDIAAFVREHDVDCDFQDVETADACYTKEMFGKLCDVLDARKEVYERLGVAQLTERKVWKGDDAVKHLGLPNLAGAITYPAHTQNPYLLVCRMLELSLDKGLNLQTNTPVYAVKPLPAALRPSRHADWAVETDRGVVRAKNVVLATNGHTNALHKGITDTEFLNPSRSQLTAICPRNGDLFHHPSLHKSVGLDDLNSGDYFLVRAPELKGAGDLVYGGGRFISRPKTTDDTIVHDGVAAYLHETAPKVFGEEAWGKNSNVVMDWSGITCYTPDTFPLVGAVPGEEGLWASVGMNGHGMAMAFRSAEALVEMMTTGEEPDWFPKTFRIARAWRKEADGMQEASAADLKEDYPGTS